MPQQYIILSVLLIYFIALFVISYLTSRKANNHTFFIGNKNSNWILVAFGMIGTSLSGVTFVSVPGTVGSTFFEYFQVVIGYFIGYFVIMFVLLPLYYRMNLTSIYGYLENRFGTQAYKTGSMFFIVSRLLGSTARLYLVVNVLQIFVFDKIKFGDYNIPFWLTTTIILLMILAYTYKGGVKTIVWTDTLQTVFMVLSLIICVVWIMSKLDLNLFSTLNALEAKNYTQIFNYEPNSKSFFLKQIIGGMFITITMTGMDQEMMQKNISVNKLSDSRKNMITFSTVMVIVNFIFLLLGGLLYLFADANGLTLKGDDIFPTIALNHMPFYISIVFVIGLISALFPSADGAITALTSAFCVDILGINRNQNITEEKRTSIRKNVHLTFLLIFLLCVLFFKYLDDKSIIDIILTVAAYTYGPLLGLFSFGIFTKRKINAQLVTFICLIAPVLTYIISLLPFNLLAGSWFWSIPKVSENQNIQDLINSGNFYQFGYELLLVNGFVTFIGLFLISKSSNNN